MNASRGLGSTIEKALAAVGVSEEKVSRWLGRPCGCSERRDRLNALDAWTRRVLTGKMRDMREHLERIMGG